MDNEVKRILNNDINWKTRRLKEHTIKHPIKETLENNNIWKKVLNLNNIATNDKDSNYKQTELKYESKSKEILYDKNAVGYFKKGINLDGTPYYSIGIFNNKSKCPLTTYIQRIDKYKNSKAYISTCFFRKNDFVTKFYYAYQILKNTNEFFTYQISKEELLNNMSIDSNFNLKEIYKLVDESMIDNDRIGSIYYHYINNRTIKKDDYEYLKLEYNNYIDKINKIDNEIKEYEDILEYLEKYTSDRKPQYAKNEGIKQIKEIIKNYQPLKKHLSSIVDISKNKVKLKLLNNKNYLEKCEITAKLIVAYINSKKYNTAFEAEYEKNWNLSQMYNGFYELVKEKIIKLEKEKNNVLNELSMDDEVLFKLCVIKRMAFHSPNYNEKDFKELSGLESKYYFVFENLI